MNKGFSVEELERLEAEARKKTELVARFIYPQAVWGGLEADRELKPQKKGDSIGWGKIEALITAKKGEHCIIYGMPNSGKTTFVYNVLVNQAKMYNSKSLIWSPEEFSTTHVLKSLAHIYMGKAYESLTDEEAKECKEFISKHFIILETPIIGVEWDFLEEFIGKFILQEKENFDNILLDHIMMLDKTLTNHEDNVKFLMSSIINMSKTHNCFIWMVNHTAAPKIFLDSKTHSTYIPPQDPSQMAHGQMWYRRCYNCIEVYRPTASVYEAELNEVWIRVKKVKNPDVGRAGQCEFFYNIDARNYSDYSEEKTRKETENWYE